MRVASWFVSAAVFFALPCAHGCAAAAGEPRATADAAASGSSSARPQTPGDLRDLITEYAEDRAGVRSFYDTPWSARRFDRLERLLDDWERGRLPGVDFQALDPQGSIDYILLREHLAAERTQLDLERRQRAEMDPLLPFAALIDELERARSAMEPIDARTAAARVAEIPDLVKGARQRVERARDARRQPEPAPPGDAHATAPPAPAPAPGDAAEAPPDDAERGAPNPAQPGEDAGPEVSPVLARRAAAVVDALRRTLRDWYEYHAGYKPEFSWWVKAPHGAAASALEEYARFLRREVAGIKDEPDDPLIGDPIGDAALRAQLRHEFIAYSPEELIAIADAEFAWCQAELRRAAADMGLGDDWRAALERVKNIHADPGRQDELVARQSREAIRFLKERDLITVPPLAEELWRLEMISPENQRFWPFAYYGGQHMAVAYPTDAMPHADKLMSMRGNNEHFTRIVTPHELIPGHHLQGFMAERHRPYRRLFSTPFFIEGWCLHWEMRLWDLGYPRGPEDRVGMLFWRMHRCARIIVSLKFHLSQMTPAEMVDFLVERVGHERLTATSEVRRFISGDYSPLYQVAYMIGGLQVRALHAEAIASGRFTERAFHDAALTFGSIPVELIRAGMLGLPLTHEHQASWRFAGDPPAPAPPAPPAPATAPGSPGAATPPGGP